MTPSLFTDEEMSATLAPFNSARMLPRAAYVDQTVLDWERQHVFDHTWVCAGRAAAVAAGTQSAVALGATNVLLSRQADGELHALVNICRHRGHELLPCGASTSRPAIICPYHAWSYALDGTLRHAPRTGRLAATDLAAESLAKLAVAEWGGWIFVNVDGQATSFTDYIGGLDALVANWGSERLAVGAAHHYEVRANWKVVIENYHECYHCPLIHPELCRVSAHDSGDNIDALAGAFVGGAMTLADDAATMSLDGRSGGLMLAGLSDAQRRQVLYVNVFPNLLISMHPDYVMTHRIVPITPTSSSVECQWLFDPAAVAASDFDPSYAVDFWDLTNRQDWAAVESVQRSLNSPHFVPGRFAPAEDAVYHFATMVASAYSGGQLRRTSIVDDARQ
jgi:glycine betaine catabolism A